MDVGITSVLRRYCVGAIFALPSAALAEPWHGIWTADPKWCAAASQIGSVTPAPIRLTATEMAGYENTCEITETVDIGLSAWTLRATCQAEGETYDADRLVMVSENTLWMWFGDGDLIEFTRCPE